MLDVENFDALGVLRADEVRTRIEQTIPAAHKDDLNCIAYRPAAFCGQSAEVVGLYSRSSREVLVRPERFVGLERALRFMKRELQSSDDMSDRLSEKRECTTVLSDRFESAANQVLQIVYHEIGHHVYSKLKRTDPECVNRWRSLFRQKQEHISSYADLNEEENFAECYMYYVDNRNIFSIGGFERERQEMAKVFGHGFDKEGVSTCG